MEVRGSWNNAGTFTHNGGTVLFTATTTGKTIVAGSSPFNNIAFNNSGGGWTVQTNDLTAAGNLALTAAAAFTLQSGRTLTVQGNFTNAVGGSATTWTGSTLYLNGSHSVYDLNTKTTGADTYETLHIGATDHAAMWDSDAGTITVDTGGSLLSEDHGGVDGQLNVYGTNSSRTNEYWAYATDFDGAGSAFRVRPIFCLLTARP